MQEKVQEINMQGCANEILPELLIVITQSTDRSFKGKINEYSNSCPIWWESDCTETTQKRKQAFNQLKTQINIDNFIKCKNITSQTKGLYMQKARKSWQTLCNGLQQ